MSAITLEQVAKSYPGADRLALQATDIAIPDGQFAVLVGPSGCGKSTLLRIVAGLEEPDAGTVRIGDRDVTDLAPRDRDIAMVFQNYALYPHMSVRQNMGYGLKVRGSEKADVRRRVEEAAALLDLADLLDRRPSQLSGGQRQRVAMGRAIVRQPSAFLMDEPLSNLDAKLRLTMRAELARLHGELATTTIYVTHDQVEAMTLGERVIVMRDGSVQQEGTPEDLYERPRNLFVAGFIGSPPMNLLALERDGATLRGPSVTIELDAAQQAALGGREQVVAGIRPEHLQPLSPDAAIIGSQIGATIAAVERLGAVDDLLLSGDLPAHRASSRDTATAVVARVSAPSGAQPGSAVRLRVDTARLHLFDPETGLALTARTSPLSQPEPARR
ncbi:sn-glycerol-3-phosphate ABC transporter ATP-binding protein UgpC [Conexibacter stalactiti]|uniref:Sn-glycerol-3-phosphate ABC transporter ATP-binding protein UgpC n=1 Tax=Conexibacter stalactiti TaxID=1940611 RepID=A0ABU4HVN8_9ACTN|nr:sn-glycerol-3-phosphate ABC transporter ATP-binding protein UgpC [Conexibacter stalactiti]MDW5597396.1 sn-glycerol-3-phosphate ABC transporter ATP-binding protein UgpC [Conexibacter stalactiti]MEC5038038.1 sn-glycerol-3-phosphate ABC transporter ATP-binding protein UgpC [Conexibacter stalactiti]